MQSRQRACAADAMQATTMRGALIALSPGRTLDLGITRDAETGAERPGSEL